MNLDVLLHSITIDNNTYNDTYALRFFRLFSCFQFLFFYFIYFVVSPKLYMQMLSYTTIIIQIYLVLICFANSYDPLLVFRKGGGIVSCKNEPLSFHLGNRGEKCFSFAKINPLRGTIT